MPPRLAIVNVRAAGNTGYAAQGPGFPRQPGRTQTIDEDVYRWFYRIDRRGVGSLSDDGGPFGFDITAALQVDYLIERYGCDAIVETGCHRGDTTAYLARRYADIPVLSCDIDARLAAETGERLSSFANVAVRHADSPDVVEEANARYERPFYYLDAHGYLDAQGAGDWPLARELQAIDKGVVCIDDFDIGHARYAYDTYNGVRCGPDILRPFSRRIPFYYVLNLDGHYPFPCLQVGRRAGRCFFALGLEGDHFAGCDYFARRENPGG